MLSKAERPSSNLYGPTYQVLMCMSMSHMRLLARCTQRGKCRGEAVHGESVAGVHLVAFCSRAKRSSLPLYLIEKYI